MNEASLYMAVSIGIIFISVGILFLRRNFISYILAIYTSSAGVALGFATASRIVGSDPEDGISFAMGYIALSLFSSLAAMAIIYRRSVAGIAINQVDAEDKNP
jgi:NADH:ubiquinone oxidoreductase subunit K